MWIVALQLCGCHFIPEPCKEHEALHCSYVLTISSLSLAKEPTVRRGIQSLPNTTLVQNSWAASAMWGSATPPGGENAQHFTLYPGI